MIRFRVVRNDFPGASAAMRRAIGKAFANERAVSLSELNRRTPVDTGQLRASETVESDETSLTMSAGRGLPDIRAVAVHQGARRMAGRPYMTDALNARVPAVVRAIVSEAEAALR